MIQSSYLVVDLFRFSVSSWYILGRLYVSRYLPFLQGCPNLFLFNRISQGPLYFCGISCNAPLSFLILFESSLFLGESIYRFVCFVYIFFKALSFIDPFYCLFSLCFICFGLCFVIFSLLLTLGFICSLSSSLKCIMRLFWVLSCFLIQAFIAMSFPLRTASAVSLKFCIFSFYFSQYLLCVCVCNKVLLKYKGDRESFWHRHQKEAERVPPC